MSSETKFTQGEWVADVRVGCCAVYPKDSRDEWEQGLHNDDDNIYYKGYPNVATNPELAFRSEEKIANAHLIKTAPKLYAEVKSDIDFLLEIRKSYSIGSDEYRTCCVKIESKRVLLAEARGEYE